MRKFLVLIIFVFCLVLVFSQESKRARYSKYFSFGVESKKSKNTLEEHFREYMKVSERLGLSKYSGEFRAYYNKINLNKIKEFNSIGFDIVGFYNSIALRETPYELDEISLSYPVIIIGTVVGIKDLSGDYFRREVLIKVDSYLKGDYYYDTPPKIFKLYDRAGYKYIDGKRVYQSNTIPGQPLRGILNKGNKVVYFFSRINYETYSEKSKKGYPSDYEDLNVNNDEDSGYFIISKNKKLITDIIYDNLELFEKDIGDTIFSKENIDYYVKKIKKYEEINDTPNFYNRSYK